MITDYKTGKAPPEQYALPAFFALKIYALLIRKRLGRTPTGVRLLYLNGPTEYRIDVTDAQLDAMERQLNALWRAINRAIETKRVSDPDEPSVRLVPIPQRVPRLCNGVLRQDTKGRRPWRAWRP